MILAFLLAIALQAQAAYTRAADQSWEFQIPAQTTWHQWNTSTQAYDWTGPAQVQGQIPANCTLEGRLLECDYTIIQGADANGDICLFPVGEPGACHEVPRHDGRQEPIRLQILRQL